jgi:Z1 domain
VNMSEPEASRKVIRDGQHAKEALEVLAAKGIPPASLVSIAEKAVRILEHSVDPIVGPSEQPTAGPLSTDGLLYGLIQSGKTSIIQVTAAIAADNGFQCIIILTSDIDLLYDQTLERMKLALPGLSVLGKNDWREPDRFDRQLRNPPLVIVCSKNGSKLGSLLDALKAARARGISALIIDDEADQASLNTHTRKGGDQVSRINEVISGFRAFFRVNTYLQVTATPQALFLQNPEHRYRPSFTVLSEPGAGYVGGYDFFADPARRLLRPVDIEEIEQLRATHQPTPSGIIPRGLSESLLIFLVAATAEKLGNPNEHYAFLCHVSMNRKDHEHIVSLIEKFKEHALHVLQTPGTQQYEKLIGGLKEAYEDLEKTQVGLPDFETILERITFYLRGTNVKLINATSSEEIKLDAVYNIFVGGNKLGRGVTIENLLVSYYGRNPKKPNSDTVLQHARMYGYRHEELGVTRLFLPDKLAEHFSLIHDMESALRDLVKKYPEGKFEILYISSPLQATRRNVLDPDSLAAYVAGESVNPAYPLRTPEVSEHTKWIDEKLKGIPDEDPGHEATIDGIIELLEHCPNDPKAGAKLWRIRIIRTALETIRSLLGNKAYVVIRRGRSLTTTRRETQGILAGRRGEEDLAPKDAPTLFLYRQNEIKEGDEAEVWWPQLRFPESRQGRNYVLSFSIYDGNGEQ